MSGVSSEYRLATAALLALSLHAVVLFQQVTYGSKEPVVRFRQQMTVSLGRPRVTEKRSAVKTIRRKQLLPIHAKSKPHHKAPAHLAAIRPQSVKSPDTRARTARSKKADIPSKKQSLPAKIPASRPPPSAQQFTAEREHFASTTEPIPAPAKPESTGKQTIQQAVPKYNLNPPPRYPLLAKRRSLEGVAVLEALVDVTGKVVEVKIFTTSGHSILDKAAIKAIRRWSFTPGSINGIRKKMWVKIPLCFRLTEK